MNDESTQLEFSDTVGHVTIFSNLAQFMAYLKVVMVRVYLKCFRQFFLIIFLTQVIPTEQNQFVPKFIPCFNGIGESHSHSYSH